MFRVIKPLNNNGLLALTEEGREVILLGKGIGKRRRMCGLAIQKRAIHIPQNRPDHQRRSRSS